MSLNPDAHSFNLIDEAVDKAWKDPKKMADLVLTGVNTQTTVQELEQSGAGGTIAVSPVALPEDEQDGTARTNQAEPATPVLEPVPGAPTKEEVTLSLEPRDKGKKADRTPRTLRGRPDLVAEVGKTSLTLPHSARPTLTPRPNASEESFDLADVPASEASEVTSLHHQLHELRGVVDSMSRDLFKSIGSLESRLSVLESRSAAVAQPGSHRVTLSGSTTLPFLPLGPKAPVASDIARSTKAEHEDLLEQCRGAKYTPSKLSQKQILTVLSGGADLSGIVLPLTRQQWKPEGLYKLVKDLK